MATIDPARDTSEILTGYVQSFVSDAHALRTDDDQVLRAATDAAIARGVFGVPTFELGGRLFWGLEALPMLRAALLGDAWFDGPTWDEAGAARPARHRSR